jgi:hypothetical protein
MSYYDFFDYSYLYHHGTKGMHWGIRRYQNPDGSLTAAGKLRLAKNKILDEVGNTLGKDSKAINKATNTSGKLRKTYFEMNRYGVKYKDGKYVYENKAKDYEKHKKQKALVSKAKRYTKDYISKYGDKPMSYLQSKNAMKGAAVGALAATLLPVVGVWMTVPAGYMIGAKIGTTDKKHKK